MSSRRISDEDTEACIDFLAGEMLPPFRRIPPFMESTVKAAKDQAYSGILNCLVVSKLFYRRASAHLYATICLVDAPYKWHKDQQLLESLVDNPQLSKSICAIEIYLKPVRKAKRPGSMGCPKTFIPDLLNLLQHESQNSEGIISLRISSMYPTDDPEPWSKMDNALLYELYRLTFSQNTNIEGTKEIALQNFHISDLKDVPLDFITSFKPSIKHLTMHNLKFRGTATFQCSTSFEDFSRLNISEDTTPDLEPAKSPKTFFEKLTYDSIYSDSVIGKVHYTFWRPFSQLIELEFFLLHECDRQFFDVIEKYVSHRLEALIINTMYYKYPSTNSKGKGFNERMHVIDIGNFPRLQKFVMKDHRSPAGVVESPDTVTNLVSSDIYFLASLFEVGKPSSLKVIQASMRFSIKDKHVDGTWAILSKEYYYWQQLNQLLSPKYPYIRIVDLTIELEDFDATVKMEEMLEVAKYIKQKILDSFTNLSNAVPTPDCRRPSPVIFTLNVLPIPPGTRREI